MSQRPEGHVEIGTVVRPQGVRGDLRVRLHNPGSTTLKTAGADSCRLVSVDRAWDEEQVKGRQGEFVTVRVESVDSREAADALRGATLFAPRQGVAIGPDEYLYVDLIGCEVAEKDRSYGHVKDVFHAGASDVLVVRDGAKELLIPLVDDWIVEVSLDRRTIEIRDGHLWEAVSA